MEMDNDCNAAQKRAPPINLGDVMVTSSLANHKSAIRECPFFWYQWQVFASNASSRKEIPLVGEGSCTSTN